MLLQSLLITASLLAGATANPAAPRYGWVEEYAGVANNKRDTSFPATVSPSCVDFVIGSDGASSGSPSGSQVCIAVDPATHKLTVTYPTSPQGYSYVSEHVWVGCSAPTGTKADKSQSPGTYPFTSEGGACTMSPDKSSATCSFNIDTILAGCKTCDKGFYIVAHASLTKTLPDGTTSGVTGAGKGTKFDNAWHRMAWNPTFYCLVSLPFPSGGTST